MKKKYICYFACFFGMISAILIVSFFSLNTTRKVIYHGNQLSLLIDGEEASKLPTSGNYYLSSYDCSNKNTLVSWNRETYQLSVTNGNKNGGVSCYLTFESSPKLTSVPLGSFVKYSGNNGCVGDKCDGENANYVLNQSNGYCYNQSSEFYYGGFRVAYIKDGSAYLISAGSPECLCTNKDFGSSRECSGFVDASMLSRHIENLNTAAIKYCNLNFVYDGVCDTNSVWNMNQDDFDIMARRELTIASCYELQNKKCGYDNDLIDNGGDYWLSVPYNSLSNKNLYWSSRSRFIGADVSQFGYGLRPVIRMDSNVIVIGGSGTYKDPYQIANQTFLIGNRDVDKNTLSLKMIGYQVDKMCINLNSTACTNYVPFQESYTLDLAGMKDDNNVIYVYYKDVNDKIIATIYKNYSTK